MAEYNLGTARGRIDIDASGATRGVGQATGAVKGMRGGLQQNQQALRRTGAGMMAVGAAAAAGLGAAVRTAAGFEQKMNRVGAVSGATGKDFDALTEQAKELGASTAFSASEAAEGMSFLAMAGFEVNEITAAMPGVLDLAAAGQLNLADAADIASNVLTGYQLEASEVGRVNDVLAYTASNANTDIGQLGDAMSYVAPVAASSGISIEQTASAIAAMSDAGIQGSRAGTTLRQAIAKLESQTPKAAKALERLGVSTHDSDGNLRSMDEIVGQLSGQFPDLANHVLDAEGNFVGMEEATANLGDAGAKTGDLMEIFGTRAGPGMATLIAKGADGLKAFEEELENSGGTAKEMADRQLEGLNGALTILRSAMEGAAIAIGEKLTPSLEVIADTVAAVAQWFANLGDRTQTIIAFVAAGAAAFFLLGGAFILILGMLPLLTAGFATFTGVILPIVGPILAVIAVLAALAIGLKLLWERSQTFRDIVRAAWASVQEGVAAVVDWFRAEALPFLQQVWTQIQTVFQSAKDAILAIVQTFLNIIVGFWNRFGVHLLAAAQELFAVLKGLFVTTWNTIKGIIQGVLQVIKGIFDVFAGIFTGDWRRVWEGVKSIFAGLWRVIVSVFKQIIGVIVAVWKGAWTTIKTVLGAGVAAVSQIWSFAWNAIKTFFKSVWNGIMDILRAVVRSIKRYITSQINDIRSTWNAVWSAIKNFFSSVWNAIVSFVRGQVNKIKSEIQTALNFIRSVWNRAWNAVSEFVSRAWNRISSAVRRGAGNVLDYIKNFPRHVLTSLGSLGSLLYNAGRDLLQGLINGIKSMASAPVDAVKGVVSKVRNLLPFSPAKEGPLHDNPPDEAGRTIGQMMASGIESSLRDVMQAATSIAAGVDATLQSTSTPLLGAARATANGTPSAISRREEIHLNGDLVLPNIRTGNDAQALIDGLRQAARQGAR